MKDEKTQGTKEEEMKLIKAILLKPTALMSILKLRATA